MIFEKADVYNFFIKNLHFSFGGGFTKQLGFLIGFFIITLTVLPAVVVLRFPNIENTSIENVINAQNQQEEETTVEAFAEQEDYPTKVLVYIKHEDVVKEFDLEEYLVHVVAAEMPASFEMEALKAQAVAARTYIVNKMLSGNYPPEHKGAAVCTDYTHCKAYISLEDAKAKFGDNFDEYWSKIQEAVKATQDEIIVYNNEPIVAVFHSQSHGKTENAHDVWGGYYPYLLSVDSPYDNQVSYATFTFDDFCQRIKNFNPDANIQSPADVKSPILTDAGAVKTINIGGVDFKGTQIRSIFNLKSHCFTISFNGDKVTFTVKGYGHGVGMSQNGANEPAKEGKKYDEILKVYYTNVDVVKNDNKYY